MKRFRRFIHNLGPATLFPALPAPNNHCDNYTLVRVGHVPDPHSHCLTHLSCPRCERSAWAPFFRWRNVNFRDNFRDSVSETDCMEATQQERVRARWQTPATFHIQSPLHPKLSSDSTSTFFYPQVGRWASAQMPVRIRKVEHVGWAGTVAVENGGGLPEQVAPFRPQMQVHCHHAFEGSKPNWKSMFLFENGRILTYQWMWFKDQTTTKNFASPTKHVRATFWGAMGLLAPAAAIANLLEPLPGNVV